MRPYKTRSKSVVRILSALGAWYAAGLPSTVWALDEASADSPQLGEILVIGTTPVPGANIDIDKVPGNVQSVRAGDLRQEGTAKLADALNARLGSVSISDTMADPFQPDILYRGFEASPVLGTPAGLAVYQNGVRINEAFGDTVNWDLIPDIAIDRVDIQGSNPVYGLNALGGAMTVTMKNGFSNPGTGAELSAGSFNQRTGSAEFGSSTGVFGVYAAARDLEQDGWRYFAQDSLHQYYLDLSVHADAATIDLSYSRADNQLNGQGAAPVQSLAINPENVFTGPQDNINNLDLVTLNASYALSDAFAVQSVAYFRNYRQSVSNGNTTEYTACTSEPYLGSLCQSNGITPLYNSAGALLPDISDGGTRLIGENDFESIHSESLGGSLQLTSTHALFGRENHFALGESVDSAHIDFNSGAQIGLIDAQLTVLPSRLYVDTPENTAGFSATPVSLRATNHYYGFFATDTFNVNPALALSAGGRYNIAEVDLSDQLGTALDGNNRFTHFNPSVGATYKLSSGMTAFGGYSINNRAPTASEIECSDPRLPCVLPSNLAGDPPNLKQVISHTIELGLRGQFSGTPGPGRFSWNASVFRVDLEDDIYGVATSISTGYFQNIGSTRRQGFESGITYQGRQWSVYAQYSFVDATFRSALTSSSPENPFANASGNIQIEPGDRLPAIPQNRLKAGADYTVLRDWTVGGSLILVSDQYYHGDESNQNPPLPGYFVASLRSSYRVGTKVEIFANVHNLFDRRYATYGLYSDPTGAGAPGVPAGAETNGPGVDNRFQSPAMPRAYVGGIRIIF